MDTTEGPLAAYAASSDSTRGRRYPEDPPTYRTEYQRDRDRIVHAKAFRRLLYKTQVFVNHEGDHYRTRMTHSLEVAQIARTVARAMHLNEDLVEAICLAHDLGHTPFGHAGQDALNDCMRDYGGFEHNLQSLRVVDELEERYASFPGLNLSFETREGILKHCALKNARELGDVGRRFIGRRQPGLEAQLANIADEIAYNNHDVDDGLRSGLITIDQLLEVPFFAEQYRIVTERYPKPAPDRLEREVVRQMINTLVIDLLETSNQAVASAGPADIDGVRALDGPLIQYSPACLEAQRELKRFLRTHLYTHPHVQKMTDHARTTVHALFTAFMDNPKRMPAKYTDRTHTAESTRGESGRARMVADYIAGMTDRFASQAREKLDAG